MIKIETETIIPASPEQIWDILTDFESYPEWNPMILEVTGKPVIGAKLKLKVSAPDNSGRKYSFKAVIVNNQPSEMLAWKGGVPGILSGFHYWKLSSCHSGTRLIHGEDFFGLYAWFMGRERIMSLKPAYENMNVALNERVSTLN